MQEVTPARTTERIYQCRCMMRQPHEPPTAGRCPTLIGPDEPFCSDCEDRHPGYQTQGLVVTVYTGR